jgi:hypothetical protein
MLGSPEAATLAHLSMADAAITLVSSRPAMPRVFVLPRDLGPSIKNPTQVVLETLASTDTAAVISAGPSQQTRADASVSQLLKLAKLDRNWDGYGAEKPKVSSINSAKNFIRSLAPEIIIPQPALHADGNAILFFRSDDAYAELEFIDQKIEFYARQGDLEWADEFQPNGPLPIALSEIGFSI